MEWENRLTKTRSLIMEKHFVFIFSEEPSSEMIRKRKSRPSMLRKFLFDSRFSPRIKLLNAAIAHSRDFKFFAFNATFTNWKAPS